MKNRFVFFCIVFLILSSISLLFIDKGAELFFINSFHNPFLDSFFYFLTLVGDGWVSAVLALSIFLFKNMRLGLLLGLSSAIGGIIAQLFKRNVFAHLKRPKGYFEDMSVFHTVPGVELHANFSFPSGHTTNAFAIFAILALLDRNPRNQGMFFIVALLIGFSRMYLLQHFYMDVVAGAFLGTGVAILILGISNKFNLFGEWSERSLLKFRKKA